MTNYGICLSVDRNYPLWGTGFTWWFVCNYWEWISSCHVDQRKKRDERRETRNEIRTFNLRLIVFTVNCKVICLIYFDIGLQIPGSSELRLRANSDIT